MMNITGLEGTYLLPPDAVKYQPVVMVVSSSSLAGMWCWKRRGDWSWSVQPNWQSGRLEGTIMGGKYSGVTGLKDLSSRDLSLAEHGVESIILESQHNSTVSKFLQGLVAKCSSYSPVMTGPHKEWKFTAAVIYCVNSNGYGYGVSMITENGIRS